MRVAVLGLAALLMWGCEGKEKEIKPMGAMEAAGQVQNGFAVLVDVREADEVSVGMAEPALWVPLTDIENEGPRWKEFLGKLKKDQKVILYCESGYRATRVAEILSKLGYEALLLGKGRFKDWKEAGLPTKPGAG